MDLSLFCTDDSLPSSEPHTDGQTEVLAHELGTETLSKTAENNTINITTEEKLSDCDRSNYSAHSISFCPEASQKPASKGPCCLDLSEPESDALFPVPELCNDFIPILSSTTEFYAGPETSLLPHEHKMRTTEFNNLESVEVSAPLSDLYIFESETQDFIITHTANPHKVTSPEYLPVSHSGGKAVQEWDAHDPMCYLEATEKRCQSGFREERASENNVSDVSQREELQATAVDAWEVDWMSENDVRPKKAEVTALMLQRQHSNSPTELWLDACQYLTGEEAEDKEVLDQQAISNSLQESDYNPSDSRRIGWSPVKRWSSVDSWASARSDWTGIIEDPPEDITAAFAEIGAEIDALTQALREVTTHREPEVLQEDPRATVEEEKQRTMGVQDQPFKTSDIPEGSVSSEQSCLSLCLEASRPKLCKREGTNGLRSLSKFEGELKPEEPSSCSAPENSSAGSFSVRAESNAELMEVTINAGSVSSGCLNLPQFDRYLKSFAQDLFSSEEDHPIELKITEDVDLDTQREVVLEEGFGDSLFKLPSEYTFSQQSSVTEEHFKGNRGQTDCRVFSTDIHKNSNEPGVDSGINVSFNICSDSVGARKVESYSPELIMCLDPVSGDSTLVCETNSSLEGDQSCTETCLSDSIDCCHVPDYSTFPTLGGITNEQFLEGHKELIHKTQNIINTAEKVSPDELQEVEPEEPVWPFLSVTADSRDLARFTVFPGDHLFISEKDCVACITLDLNDPFVPWISEPIFTTTESELSQLEMPHKTSKNSSDKLRTKKEKSALNHHGAQAPKQESTPLHISNQQTWKQQESSPATWENHIIENNRLEVNETKVVMENIVGTEKGTGKPHGKKKKKHGHKAAGKQEAEASVDLENGAKAKTTKGKVDMFETKLGIKGGKAQQDVKQAAKTQKPEDTVPQQAPRLTNDDVVKKRRVSGDKFGKILSVLESKLPKADASLRAKEEETQTEITASQKKTYSDVVKQKIPPKEDPKVVESIQAVSVSGDPQSLCLWCQFAGVHSDYTVTWSRDTTPLAQVNRSAGDESRVSLIINNATHKDLGKYVCQLSCSHGSVYLDYVLTYEVLSEIVIPASPKFLSSVAEELCSEEEDAHCSRLLFKEDFLSDQYFGENHPIRILTEKVHFGEGMHRRAFRTKLKAGQIPLFVPGNSCVLKVHNSISYGTKNNDDILQKNFNLAVEECQVQNTAREYIKAYTSAAQSVEAFGDVPEIIPIYLVHRPSNDIPYATLEEELIGDFVKYSVKDGKEINVMRRDSEAGQKCCAFQHWVYHNTEGNLLVTDMQGVGMKLTDVGIATCKKGYKGFKGNCATSFIDQFKALHQCNKYCEILGLKPLQPKPKKVPAAPKPKPPPSAVPKKKTFGPTMKNKS
ncbi:alpha-protein kinase 2 isoform X1 [Cyprinodon tularosa]|uniref:alpha-protein kinase 2 isoform X1 n=1 Tax=Cyprinodon tularosa TaxID=77115 RepID=UPI0018E260D0|nr:alpha-protein kinase 2 isoform X1 [Cyprinodon tularosa]